MFGGHRSGDDDTLRRIESELRDTRDIAVRAETKAENHIVSCIEHNRRIEDALVAGQVSRQLQHGENQKAIGDVHSRVNEVSRYINRLALTAMGTCIVAGVAALYAVFARKLGLGP